MKVSRILVPVDFSPASLAALETARDLAESLGARVEVLHVVEIMSFAPVVGPPTELAEARRFAKRAARQRLDKLRRKLEPQRPEIRFALSLGSPHRMILDAAKRLGADLIVMATHGRSGLPRLFLGSVAEKIVHAATCPVMTIRPQPKVRPRPRQRRPAGQKG